MLVIPYPSEASTAPMEKDAGPAEEITLMACTPEEENPVRVNEVVAAFD